MMRESSRQFRNVFLDSTGLMENLANLFTRIRGHHKYNNQHLWRIRKNMTQNDRLRPWNTMMEVAEYLRLSLRTVERRIKDGVLPVRRDGRLVRIAREAVLQYERAF